MHSDSGRLEKVIASDELDDQIIPKTHPFWRESASHGPDPVGSSLYLRLFAVWLGLNFGK